MSLTSPARGDTDFQARLLEAVGEAVVATDLEGVIIHWNRAAERLYGWSAKEAIGRSVLEVTVAASSIEDVRGVIERLRAGESWSEEFLVRRKDGSTFTAMVTNAPIENEAGEVVGVIGTSIDMTAHRKAQEAIRASEERFRMLFETMAQGVIFRDRKGTVVSGNPAAERILGLTVDQMAGRVESDPRWHVVHEDGSRFQWEHHPAMVALRTGREGDAVRMGIFHPHEERYRWILAYARPLLGADGTEVEGVFTTFTDVTSLRRVEDELRRAKKRMDAILDTTPLATVVIGKNRTVLLWNPAAEELFGWRAEEVLGKPYPLQSPEGEQVSELLKDAFAGKLWNGDEVRRVARDGSVRELSLWNARLHDENGDLEALVGVFADNAARKALEDQLRHAQKLEAVGRLAGGVAHDFNNILTAITGYTEFVLQDLDEESPLRADVDEIRKGTTRATTLTRQLLAFSRIQVLKPKVIDIEDLFADVEKMLRRLIGEDIDFHTTFDATLARIRADPSQIEQVLMNLALNARDAMPGGGTLAIRCRNVVVDERNASKNGDLPPGHFVAMEVSDSGSGIDEDVLPHIFEPFFTTKESGKGTGLGLSMVYGIVRQSGGAVLVESAPDDGTVFTVLLPAVDDPVSPRRDGTEAVAPQRDGAETILLVEDEEPVRSLVRRVLLDAGYVVLEAKNGAAALEVARDNPDIALLLTDVVMPHMGGQELARRLQESRPGLRVLFTSGYADERIEESGILEEDVAFLEKPFAPGSIARRVRQVLDAPPRG